MLTPHKCRDWPVACPPLPPSKAPTGRQTTGGGATPVKCPIITSQALKGRQIIVICATRTAHSAQRSPYTIPSCNSICYPPNVGTALRPVHNATQMCNADSVRAPKGEVCSITISCDHAILPRAPHLITKKLLPPLSQRRE